MERQALWLCGSTLASVLFFAQAILSRRGPPVGARPQ
jgi:hypothetical protein